MENAVASRVDFQFFLQVIYLAACAHQRDPQDGDGIQRVSCLQPRARTRCFFPDTRRQGI